MARPDAVTLNETSGNDVVLTFTVTDDGSAVNLSGMTPAFAISRRGSTVVSTDTSPQTATYSITDAANGVFTITIDKAITEPLVGAYTFEAEVTDTSSDTSTVAHGTITFAKNIL